MEMDGWKLPLAAVTAGTMTGIAFWLIAWAGLLAARLAPARVPFAADLLHAAGDRDRVRYRAAGRELGVLLGALLAIPLAAALAWPLLSARTFPAVPAWALIVAGLLALAAIVAGLYLVGRLLLRRRRLVLGWAARVAVGNILKRLNLGGNRIFHDVAIEGACIDHVVIGRKGVFAVNVVPRRIPKNIDGRAAAELRNGKLWMAGNVEALPVGDAARNMTLLSAALSRVTGHRVAVKSVLAVPGWHTVPNGAGNHLVLNENNLAMLTSWNPPEAYLMDEDFLELQKFLADASRVARFE